MQRLDACEVKKLINVINMFLMRLWIAIIMQFYTKAKEFPQVHHQSVLFLQEVNSEICQKSCWKKFCLLVCF